MQWLKLTLAQGIGRLVLLKLKNAPADDAIEMTMEAWYQTLTFKREYEQELDQWRLEEAFMWLSQRCEWFPTPKELLDNLPPRRYDYKPELEVKIDPEKTFENVKKLRKMIGKCYVPTN